MATCFLTRSVLLVTFFFTLHDKNSVVLVGCHGLGEKGELGCAANFLQRAAAAAAILAMRFLTPSVLLVWFCLHCKENSE